MAQATAWVRRYADEGRLRKLMWFVVVSGAIYVGCAVYDACP